MAPATEAKPETEVVYGRKAVLALLEHRPGDALRLHFSGSQAGELGRIVGLARRLGLPCQVMEDRGLEKVACSLHHEGVVLVCKPRVFMGPHELSAALASERPCLIVALEEITNPHNIGAIVRSAAFFGVHGLSIVPKSGERPLPPSAVRIAEGGAEQVRIAVIRDLPGWLRLM
ncbi:MAG: hypothetical protein N2515_07185, partial [Deltaproteobacteria bacterium]|nr:hypothetical protein [Deltaproteobacteria bacterium]